MKEYRAEVDILVQKKSALKGQTFLLDESDPVVGKLVEVGQLSEVEGTTAKPSRTRKTEGGEP